LEYFGLWDKNTIDSWPENFTDNIKVVHTPGHDYTGITLFVKTKDGTVAICGDVFWKEDYPHNPKDDTFASNPDRLEESREMVLKTADWIIPGHGAIYENNRSSALEKDEITDKKQPKVTVVCKRCGRQMEQKDKCLCRPYLCFNCCECGLDCDLCYCSHQRKQTKQE
jgi:glyoxylase-like metal-dependent hydrolase (beta-lactamase superfamily II)